MNNDTSAQAQKLSKAFYFVMTLGTLTVILGGINLYYTPKQATWRYWFDGFQLVFSICILGVVAFLFRRFIKAPAPPSPEASPDSE